MELKIKELKVKVEEHNKCERNIDNLNKLIEMNRRELEMKTTQIAKQERKNIELNSKLKMADKALAQFEQNKSQNKLKLKKNKPGLNLPNINNETNKSQLMKNKQNYEKYLNTLNNNIKMKEIFIVQEKKMITLIII